MAAEPPTAEQVALRVAHLSMIQGIVSRMSGNSAAIKGFCVTISAAVVAIGSSEANRLLGLLPFVALFCLADSWYLGMERQYRALYESVAKRPFEKAEDLSMARPTGDAQATIRAMFSRSVGAFYLFVAIFVVAIWLATRA